MGRSQPPATPQTHHSMTPYHAQAKLSRQPLTGPATPQNNYPDPLRRLIDDQMYNDMVRSCSWVENIRLPFNNLCEGRASIISTWVGVCSANFMAGRIQNQIGGDYPGIDGWWSGPKRFEDYAYSTGEKVFCAGQAK
jgi:hypothetical protein